MCPDNWYFKPLCVRTIGDKMTEIVPIAWNFFYNKLCDLIIL